MRTATITTTALACLALAWSAHAAPDEAVRTTTKTVATAHRASNLIGMTVKNSAGHELGTVEDLVLDLNGGKLRYAALSFGGFLGVGDKLFAIPWTEFEAQYDPDADENVLVLDIDKATLEKAPGFNKDQWPNFGDDKWSAAVDEYYSARRPNEAVRK